MDPINVTPVAAPVATAPVAAPVDNSAAVAQTAPAVTDNQVTPEPSVQVPAGTKNEIKAIFEAGQKPEEIEAFLAKHTPEVAEKLKALFAGDESLSFEEITASEPAEFSPFSEEELSTLPPEVQVKLKGYESALEEAISKLETAPAVPEEVRLLEQDPVFKLRLDQLRSGSIDVNPVDFDTALSAAGIDTKALLAKVQDLFETEGQEPAAIQLLQDAFKLAMDQGSTLAAAAERARAENEAAIRIQRVQEQSFYKGELDKISTTIPEFKGQKFYIETPDGQVKLNTEVGGPAGEFLKWAVEMNRSDENGVQVISDAYIRKFGLEGVYQQWKIANAGSVGQYLGETKRSMLEQARDKMSALKRNALSTISAQTPAISSTATAKITVHGVDIARAVTDNRYAQDNARILTSSQAKEVIDAMMKYAASSAR